MTVRVAQIFFTIYLLGISAVASVLVLVLVYNQFFLGGIGLGAGLLTQAIVLVAIWGKTVRWNQSRSAATILTPFVLILISTTLCIAIHNVHDDAAQVLIVGTPFALQPILLMAFWTEWSRAGFRPAQSLTPRHTVACPNCNYDLSASNESRCPECGTQHTLGELFTKLTATDPIEQPPSPDKPKA